MRRLTLLFLLTIVSVGHAQDSLRFRYGLEGGWSANMHTADFRALPGVPNCCPQFSSGSGGGPQAGIFAAWPISASMLLSVAANYQDHSATLTNDQQLWILVNGNGQSGTDRHTVEATLSTIGIEPSLSYNLFGGLFASVGGRLGFLVAKKYSQDERIVAPAGTGTFLDSNGNDTHSQIRNQNSGTLPSASSVLLFASAGLSYELPLNAEHSLFLVPQVSYSLALSNLSTVTWKPNAVRAGIGLTFSPKPDTRSFQFDTTIIRDTSVRTDRQIAARALSLRATDRSQNVFATRTVVTTTTIIREHYLLEIPDQHDITCRVNVVGLDEDNNEKQIATLRIEEFMSTNAHPLLGFVFFEEGDSTIPARYELLRPEQAAHFDLHSLFTRDAVGIHHTALNIIAERMKLYPSAHLSINGCNANIGVEEGNTALSASRARAVYDYLRTVWNIPASRLSMSSRDLPERPSNPRTPDGQAENRRVELTCDVPDVLDVFIANDTIRTPNPPQLRFKLSAASSVGVASWQLEVLQGRTLLHHEQGSGDVPVTIDWDLEHDKMGIPRYNEPLRIFLRTTNSKGDVAIDSTALPTEVLTVEQKKARHSGDVVIDRYNLVLFSFGTSAMTPAHERVLKLVKAKLKPRSTISIEGYTDRTGSAASNKKLATGRATSTAAGLGRDDASVKGIGEDRLLYPNETPEGRFLCRTVQIEVRTPIE